MVKSKMAIKHNIGEESRDLPANPQRRKLLQAGLVSAGMALRETVLHAQETQQKAMPPKPEGEGTAMPSAFAAQNVMNHSALHAGLLAPLPMTNTGPGQIPQKALGKTGVNVSIIGIGGATLGQAKSYDEAEKIVHEAVNAGVNFFDNAWEYNEHKSEEWMGQALQGRRDKVFLMTKVCTHGRDAKVAMQQLEESLRRLRTDHLDLWQVHEVIHFNDPDLHFMPGGVVEALAKAQQQGKVRFVGFTGHKNPMIHLRMLELADQHNVKFDTIQMPLNPFDASFRSFAQHVLPEAHRRGMGALGMKSLGGSGEAVLQGANHRAGSPTLRDEPARRHDHQRNRLAAGAASESWNRPRLQTHDGDRDAVVAGSLRRRRFGRSPRTLQDHQKVRCRRRSRAARLPLH